MNARLLLPLVLALLAGCSLSSPRPELASGAPADAPLPGDTVALRGELSNGLRYYIRRNHEPRDRAELRLVVRAGSILEDEDQRGLAHFVEHMAFNGTEHFRKQELVDYLERVGMRFGPDVNAYTSFDETVYMLTLPTDTAGVVETGVQILRDWAGGISFDSVEVEKERGVVLEEWRLGQGAGSRMQRKQLPALMGRSRYTERLPIGTPESLRSFRHEALRRFYRDWYRPDLMAVVAVGDIDPERMEQLIREHFGDLAAPEAPRERREYGVPEHQETVVSVVSDEEATTSNISLYLKQPPNQWTTVRAYRDWIVESLASGMLSSRLSERTQRPESPFLDVSSYQGRFIRPLAVYMLSVRVPEGGIERGLEELLLEVERVDQHGFTPTELEREKTEMLRRMEQRYAERDKTTSGSYAADYVAHFVYGGTVVPTEAEYALYRDLLPQVRLEEVNAVVRQWKDPSDRVVLVNVPEKNTGSAPGEDRLRAVIRSVQDRPVVAYTDSVSDAPLLPHPPQPGTVVAERRVEQIGVTEWTLSNGVRVVMKPTDFRADEVLLAARSPGGTSLLPDSDHVAALTATAVVQAGGLGELSTTELRKRLAGKMAGVGADISEHSEGLSGGASPQDLETLLQLVYLKFTAPRLDSAAVEAYRAQAIAALANRSASPEAQFMDSLRVILSQNHPRARPPSSEMFNQLDVERSLQIYRDRFADASDFTFYLVGSFQPEQIRPLVLRYLGGLPSLNRQESGRDLGIRPPRGVVRRVVRKGIEPKSLAQIVFTGEMQFGRENVYLLSALGEVLQLRLRTALREDLGGTYGVQVRAGGASEPNPRFQVSVGFGADPARVDELTRVVFAQIDSLRRFGPTEEELAKVREMHTRERQTELRSNQFWMSQIVNYDRLGWKLPDILAYEQLVEGLDAGSVREAAARYLDTGNFVQVVLLPEAAAASAGPSGGTELP